MILENGTPVFFQWQRAGRYDFDDFLVGSNPARNGSSLLIRRSCFEDVGGFNEELHSVEDLDMWLRIADGSKTPVLWASKHFLVDLRLRPGSVTRNRTASETALADLLEGRIGQLRRLPAGLAYVRPAVAAFKHGSDDDLASYWAAKARSAGLTAPAQHAGAAAAVLAHPAPGLLLRRPVGAAFSPGGGQGRQPPGARRSGLTGDSRPRRGGGPMRPPILVGELELASPVPDIEPPAGDGDAYTAVRLLVRVHREPAGYVLLSPDALDAVSVAERVWQQLGPAIHALRERDGLPALDALPPDGLPAADGTPSGSQAAPPVSVVV